MAQITALSIDQTFIVDLMTCTYDFGIMLNFLKIKRIQQDICDTLKGT